MPHLTPSSLGAESNHTVVFFIFLKLSTAPHTFNFHMLHFHDFHSLWRRAVYLAPCHDGFVSRIRPRRLDSHRGSRGRRRNSLIDTRYMRKCLSRAGYDESLLYSLKRGTRSEARSLQPFLPRCPGVNDVQNKIRWWWMPPILP